MSTEILPALGEQSPRSGGRSVKDRLRNLWEKSSESPAASTERQSLTIAVFDGYKIEAKGTNKGWRVRSKKLSTGIQHEFFVHQGEIFHISLWNHPIQFVVGCRVKRIMESERQAILQAV